MVFVKEIPRQTKEVAMIKTHTTEMMPSPGLGKYVNILTVGELRTILAQYEDDIQILVGDDDGEYYNISSLQGVDGDDGEPCLNIFCSKDYDPRQF